MVLYTNLVIIVIITIIIVIIVIIKVVLYTNLVIVLSLAVFLYIFFSINPFSAKELDQFRIEAINKTSLQFYEL